MNSKDGKLVDHFITDDNFSDIQNGETLKITLSPSMYVDRIFNNLNNNGKAKSFDDLNKLSSDPGFIKELGNVTAVFFTSLITEKSLYLPRHTCNTTIIYVGR